MIYIDNDILRKKKFDKAIKKILSSKENMMGFLKKVHPVKDKIKTMKLEDKELLLKDLCTRLPYKILCTDLRHGDSVVTSIDLDDGLIYCFDFDEWVKIEHCKPYLRPMSSMTREECNEYGDLCHVEVDNYANIYTYDTIESIDWLNKHHFDYRGLIQRGLALEANSEMYND